MPNVQEPHRGVDVTHRPEDQAPADPPGSSSIVDEIMARELCPRIYKGEPIQNRALKAFLSERGITTVAQIADLRAELDVRRLHIFTRYNQRRNALKLPETNDDREAAYSLRQIERVTVCVQYLLYASMYKA